MQSSRRSIISFDLPRALGAVVGGGGRGADDDDDDDDDVAELRYLSYEECGTIPRGTLPDYHTFIFHISY